MPRFESEDELKQFYAAFYEFYDVITAHYGRDIWGQEPRPEASDLINGLPEGEQRTRAAAAYWMMANGGKMNGSGY